MIKIVADKEIPYLKGILESYAEVKYLTGVEISNCDIRDAEALIIRSRTICNSNLLNRTKVRFIATATTGHDHIDKAYCDSQNITWINTPGCNSSSVAQYITSALLYLARCNNFLLAGKTLGIIGVGNIGSKVAKIAEIIGMRILLNDPPRAREEGDKSFVSLEQILKESDIITLHIPLNYSGKDKTYHIVDKKFLDSIHKESYLINSSRGEVVDNKALKQALEADKLAGTILDVWENEPEIDAELLDLVTLGTPHISGYSADGKANCTSMSVKAISKFFNLGIDNPEKILEPENLVISLNCSGKTKEEIIFEAVNATCNIKADDIRLRNSLKTFEKQRMNYPLRREFPAFFVRTKNDSGNCEETLKKLGFNIRI